jgi:hypothetical protein
MTATWTVIVRWPNGNVDPVGTYRNKDDAHRAETKIIRWIAEHVADNWNANPDPGRLSEIRVHVQPVISSTRTAIQNLVDDSR